MAFDLRTFMIAAALFVTPAAGSETGIVSPRDAFAELAAIPPSSAEPIDLSEPHLSFAKAVPPPIYAIDQYGREEITVFGPRPMPWSVRRGRDAANYARLFSNFGPIQENYNLKIEKALTIEFAHITISTKGVFVWF